MSEQPTDHAIVIVITGRVRGSSPFGSLRDVIDATIAALEPALRAQPAFVPAWPPVVVSHAELRTDLPVGWQVPKDDEERDDDK